MVVELSKGLAFALRYAARVLGLSRRIPIVDDVVTRVQATLLSPVVVRLVRRPDDPDLDVALHLYRQKIPDDQRFDPADIVRWIRDDKVSRASNGPSDWFLVAKYRRQVRGFVLFHYYPSTRTALFAYMVVANTPGLDFDEISRLLTKAIARFLRRRKELRGYDGFVMEVEDPRRERLKKKQNEALARVSRFCMLAEMNGLSLRALEFDYKQPKLSLEDKDGSERSMLLLSARTRKTEAENSSHRSEVEQLLTFIYTSVYPEGYSPEPEENRAYKEYCVRLLKRQLGSLPPQIRSLSSAQLSAQLGRKKHRSEAAGC